MQKVSNHINMLSPLSPNQIEQQQRHHFTEDMNLLLWKLKTKSWNPRQCTSFYCQSDTRIQVIVNFQRSLPVLMAMAHAHDIPVPTPHTLDNMPAIHRAIWYHPKFTTDLSLCLLLIPQNEKEPLRQVKLVGDKSVTKEICKLLGCELSDSVVLHSEDQIAYVFIFIPPPCCTIIITTHCRLKKNLRVGRGPSSFWSYLPPQIVSEFYLFYFPKYEICQPKPRQHYLRFK
jgi:hypothetical protein